jgi:hypothetical protein
MALLATTLVAVETDTQAYAQSDNDDDDDADEEAPPLELSGTTGMVSGYLDLLIACLHVVDGLLGILLNVHNVLVLLLDHESDLL